MCLPRLSKTHLDGLMTRPDARSCHQTNFSDGGFVRKDPFFLISFFKVFFTISLCPFFQGVPIQLEVHFLKALSPAGRSPNNKLERRWYVRLIKCRKRFYGYVLGANYDSKTFYWVYYCSLCAQKDTMTVYSEPHGEIMPCQWCMQSSDLDKVPTHLMSDVYTFVINLILVRTKHCGFNTVVKLMIRRTPTYNIWANTWDLATYRICVVVP